uniref:Exportin-4 n=1 Tax=Kalanchoe fedtschenkoi TaxID=63787 RepID=A0A7N0ZUX4_KALFE
MQDGADMTQLQSTMLAIEHACTSIMMQVNPAAAEATIQSLSQSPHPYNICQFIIENSQVANARFQAAAAIRDAALREWVILTVDDKRNLISFCLHYSMQHANSPESYVQAKISSVAAQLLKRGWSDFTAAQKDVFFNEVKQALLGIRGVDVQYIGIIFLESLVSEFSPSTSTAMGLPREFHEVCRTSLERDYLKIFYCWAQDASKSVASRIIESSSEVPEVKVCTAALRFMLQILNWEFRLNTNDVEAVKTINIYSAGPRLDSTSPRRSECILVQPGPLWRDTLIRSGHTEWILSLYEALRQKFSREGYWLNCPIAVVSRKLIVQLCSLSGSVFPSDSQEVKENHLLQLLSGFIHWIDPPDSVAQAITNGKSDSELLDGCRALLSLATVTTPSKFDQLLKSIRPYGTFSLLSALMSEVLKDHMVNNTDEETWSWVARDLLLDIWTTLLTHGGANSGKEFNPTEGAAISFSLIVEAELKAASASVYNDDFDDYLRASVSAMDERLSSYALIARAAIEFSIPMLTRLFSDLISRLLQAGGTDDPTVVLEEIYSLLLIAGHVLADEGEGETPSVPWAIETHFSDIVDPSKHPVVTLSGSILKFAEQCLNPQYRSSIFSPRLMEALIWFLARWSNTYLMTVTHKDNHGNSVLGQQHHAQWVRSREALLSFFGEHNQGKPALDIIVRILLTTLMSYQGEKDLQALTCYMLLPALVRRKHVCSHLITLDSWRDLANAFANDRSLFSLDAALQRSLAQTLVLSASGMGNIEDSIQYVRNLINHMTTYLIELCKKKDFKHIAQQPDVIFSVTCLLERLRGVAGASQPRIQKAIYEVGSLVLDSILVLLEAYKHEFSVMYILLKFVAEWVEGQIVYLEAQETAVVVNFCMRLLQLYSSHNIGLISVSLSSNLQSEANSEKYKDLRALVQLLTSLCSKDLVDFSSDSIESPAINISEVIFFGLHIINPLISLELLKYPKLCHDYFSLLSHMLEVYPEMVSQLNSEVFSHIAGTLDYGLHHQDVEVVDMCLRSLKALAAYHYKELSAGKIGLAANAAGSTDPNGKAQESILSRFLGSLLQLLLFEDYSSDIVSSAADALLPLILAEQSQYQRMCQELIERQVNPAFKSRLANALLSLTSSNQLTSSLDRSNYQRFRRNVQSFLIEVRGFLRTV